MPAGVLNIFSTARITGGANASVLPVRVGKGISFGGDGSERFAAGRPAILEVSRGRDGTTGALDGTFGIWGADLPNPSAQTPTLTVPQVQVFRGDGSTVIFDPDLTRMPYAAFSNFNWMVMQNGVLLDQGAGAGKFQVSNPGTTQARITLGTAAPNGAPVEVYLVTPVAVLAVGANEFARSQIRAYDVMWASYVVASTNLSATLANLRPAGL